MMTNMLHDLVYSRNWPTTSTFELKKWDVLDEIKKQDQTL